MARRRHAVVLGVALVLFADLLAAQQAPRAAKPTRQAVPARTVPAPRGATGLWRRPVPTRSALATVPETEPNDAFGQANLIALNDVADGVIGVVADVDWYAIDLSAGTMLTVDVDAQALDSYLDPVTALFDRNGVTLLCWNDDFDGLDSYFQCEIPATGRYFIRIVDYYGDGGPDYYYLIQTGALTPGPGDPTTVFASGLGGPASITFSGTGEMFVADRDGRRILKLTAGGAASTFATTGTEYPQELVVDGLGDVLVTLWDNVNVRGRIVRFSPSGQPSEFASGFSGLAAITVGPDGDVWTVDVVADWLFRLAPDGTRKDSLDVQSAGRAYDMAFSPAGELHFTDFGNRVYKVAAGGLLPVVSLPCCADAIAFDRDGYLYLGNGYERQVYLYSPAYQVVSAPFALSNLDGPFDLAFARTSAGEMTSRLFATNLGWSGSASAGSVVEMNPSGIRAPGFRVGVDLLRLATTSVRDGVAGGEYADTVRVLDPPGAVTWSVSSGALPPGLGLDAASGVIAGVPQAVGAYRFTVRAEAAGRFGFGTFTIAVTAPALQTADAVAHFLGGSPLPLEVQRYLDAQGNANGRYDIGDLRAFLRANGQVPAPAVPLVSDTRRAVP